MKLHLIKSDSLLNEMVDRISDQLQDPEPQFDSLLSFLTRSELDELQATLLDVYRKRKERMEVNGIFGRTD